MKNEYELKRDLIAPLLEAALADGQWHDRDVALDFIRENGGESVASIVTDVLRQIGGETKSYLTDPDATMVLSSHGGGIKTDWRLA